MPALKVDKTTNQFRFRLKDPKKFATCRIKKLPRGVQLVVCCPKGKWRPRKKRCDASLQAQAVRIPRTGRNKKTLTQARKVAARFRKRRRLGCGPIGCCC